MQQQSRALQMSQEAGPESGTLRRAFNETGNVRHHETAVLTDVDHAQVRMERGEGIGRHFGLSRGDGAYQRGFAGIGQPEKSHVRYHLELELERALLPG